jgi:uncharacterized protein
MSNIVKLSRFAHLFESEQHNSIALYHSVKISPVYLEMAAKPLLERLEGGLDLDSVTGVERLFVNQLAELEYVVREDAPESDLDEVRLRFKAHLTTMYLILTDKCNLGCKYCFVEAGFPEGYKCATMSWEVAEKSLKAYIDQRDRSNGGQVWLYGGEPLLEPGLLWKCLDYLAKNDPEVEPVMVTNGTLITKDIAAKLSEYPTLQIAVSLDGPEEVHNQKRIMKNGQGSFAATMQGIQNLRQEGIVFGISCTLADHNVERVVDIALWMREELGVDAIGMNLLVDTPRAYVEEEYVSKASAGLIELFKIFRVEGAFESRIMRKVNAFVETRPHWHDCAACGSQMVISPEGRIGICHEGLGERKFFMGSILEPYIFEQSPLAQEWASRSPASMPACFECEALGICGGGCPYGAMLKHGSIWELDKRFCSHSKETLEWLIWDLFEKIEASPVLTE